jgi:hypothetical protein
MDRWLPPFRAYDINEVRILLYFFYDVPAIVILYNKNGRVNTIFARISLALKGFCPFLRYTVYQLWQLASGWLDEPDARINSSLNTITEE